MKREDRALIWVSACGVAIGAGALATQAHRPWAWIALGVAWAATMATAILQKVRHA